MPYEERTNDYSGGDDPEAVALPAGWTKRIYKLPPQNTSVFFYPPNPALLASESAELVGKVKSERLATDLYYYEKFSNLSIDGTSRVDYRKYNFRNGSIAWYQDINSVWTFVRWEKAPSDYYYYARETYSYIKNTSSVDGLTYTIDSTPTTFILEGYELQSLSSGTLVRYLPDLPES